MADIEKVLKALECCKNKTCDNAKPDVVCPYVEWSGEYETSYCECTERLADDALALLKAQDDVITALLKVGYPHGFEGEEPWIVDYMNQITNVIRKAVRLRND